jgi:hypothetical protein
VAFFSWTVAVGGALIAGSLLNPEIWRRILSERAIFVPLATPFAIRGYSERSVDAD